jgi:glycosyltransferase involved in cell wall biosynthesis
VKLLVISTLYKPHEIGGAEITARMIAEGARQAGHAVTAVSIAPDGRPREGNENGVKTIYLGIANVYFPHGRKAHPTNIQRFGWHVLDAFNPVMGRRVGRVMDAERPDVVHCHNLQGFSVAAWAAARHRRLAVVQTVHDYYLACANSTMYRRRKNCDMQCGACRILGTPKRLMSGVPDVVTSVSRYTLSRLEACGLFRHGGAKLIIRNSTPEGFWGPAITSAFDRGSLRVGFIGRLDPLKGLEILIEAARRVASHNIEFVIAGKGSPSYEAALRDSSVGTNVKFIGFAEPSSFYKQIHALIVPSLWHEPMPRVIIESIGYGVPVIGAALGGISEIIEDGRTGYLFPAGDAAGLAAILERIAAGSAPLAQMSDQAKTRSREFAFPAIFKQYEAAWHLARHIRSSRLRDSTVARA